MNTYCKAEDVFILIGQSNADGRAATADMPGYLSQFYNTPRPHLKIFHKPTLTNTESKNFIDDGVWWTLGSHYDPVLRTTHQNIFDIDNRAFGCELEYAYQHHQMEPGKPLRIIKAALGGTKIEGNWGITAPDDKALWTWFKDYIYKPAVSGMAAEGIMPGQVKVFWMQGESDATDKDAVFYDERLQTLVDRLNTELCAPPDSIVIGGLSSAFNSGAGAIVKQAQMDAAARNANTVFLNTDNMALYEDNLHYSAAGICDMGRAVYKITRSFA